MGAAASMAAGLSFTRAKFSVAFDTLKFARALREKANMTAEQAEVVAQAFSGTASEQLVTKSDLDGFGGDLRLRIENRPRLGA